MHLLITLILTQYAIAAAGDCADLFLTTVLYL